MEKYTKIQKEVNGNNLELSICLYIPDNKKEDQILDVIVNNNNEEVGHFKDYIKSIDIEDNFNPIANNLEKILSDSNILDDKNKGLFFNSISICLAFEIIDVCFNHYKMSF